METNHVSSPFNVGLMRLDNIIAEMGGMAEVQLAYSIEVLLNRYTNKAARVKFILHRTNPETSLDSLKIQDISLNLEEHRVSRAEINIHLGPTEYRLLRFFLEKPGRVFPREQLLDQVWGRDIYVEAKTVDVYIRRLRKALQLPNTENLIRTIRATSDFIDIPISS